MVCHTYLVNAFRLALLWFDVAITLHLIEEIAWLPAWSQKAGRWHEPVSRRGTAIAAGILLFFVYVFSFWASKMGAESGDVYVLCGLAVVLIANLFIPHMGATISQRRYAPGLVTSLLLVVPASGILLWQAWALELVLLPWLVLVGVGFLGGAAVIWPALLRIATRWESG